MRKPIYMETHVIVYDNGFAISIHCKSLNQEREFQRGPPQMSKCMPTIKQSVTVVTSKYTQMTFGPTKKGFGF
jgi:hypothetical protein